MARKDKIWIVSEPEYYGDDDDKEKNRDFGKAFYIREMSALAAERWAMRVFRAAARGGVEIPDNVAAGGVAGLAQYGFNAIAGGGNDEIDTLLAEMLECVSFIPDPSRSEVRRMLTEDDIEEIPTIIKLRMEVMNLHVGFLKGVARSSGATSPTKSAS